MPQWTKALYLAYLKSAHWKAVQKAIYRTKPRCFIHRRRCRNPNIYHLSYRNLYHESLILDGKHDLVVLCGREHKAFYRWAEYLKIKPDVRGLQWYIRDLAIKTYAKKRRVRA